MHRIFLLALIALTLQAQNYTLGVGVYPGDPKENFAPAMQIDSTNYRNLALHRPAWHSSSYDYNLTAQLVTDGIKQTELPRWVATSTSQQGVLKKNEREWILDGNWVTGIDLTGHNAWVQLELAGGPSPLEIDRIEVDGVVQSSASDLEVWACIVSGSDDGATWSELGHTEGIARTAGEIRPSIKFAAPARRRFYRIAFSDPRARSWSVTEVTLFRGAQPVPIGGPHRFSSAWKSAGAGEEWVYVDLGAACTFDRVTLSWIRPAAEGSLQISDDAVSWKSVAALPAAAEGLIAITNGTDRPITLKATPKSIDFSSRIAANTNVGYTVTWKEEAKDGTSQAKSKKLGATDSFSQEIPVGTSATVALDKPTDQGAYVNIDLSIMDNDTSWTIGSLQITRDYNPYSLSKIKDVTSLSCASNYFPGIYVFKVVKEDSTHVDAKAAIASLKYRDSIRQVVILPNKKD